MTNEVFAPHVGRACRARAGRGVLAAADRPRPGGPPRPAVHRRGLLGHGVDAPAAGLRPLLRQAPLRPAGARAAEAVRGHLQADAGLPGAPGPVHREPRRAARGGDVRPGAGARRGGRDRRRCRARGCSTTASSTGTACTSRSSSAAGPTSRRTTTCEAFYRRLLRAVADADIRHGDWRLCDCEGWPDNASTDQLVAWCWANERGRHLVVVNLAGAPAQARVRLPWGDLGGRGWTLTDRLTGQTFAREGDELAASGPVRRPRPMGLARPRAGNLGPEPLLSARRRATLETAPPAITLERA